MWRRAAAMHVMAASTTAGLKMLAGRKMVRSRKPYKAFFVLNGIVFRRECLGAKSADMFSAQREEGVAVLTRWHNLGPRHRPSDASEDASLR